MPYLRDASHRLIVAGPADARTQQLVTDGATSILYHAANYALAGVYVDNETPNRDYIARGFVAQNVGLVVVGLYPSEPNHRIPGCLCALEWYPYHEGWGKLPRGPEAYILQREFAWPGDRPPSWLERWRLLVRARSYRPKLILTY